MEPIFGTAFSFFTNGPEVRLPPINLKVGLGIFKGVGIPRGVRHEKNIGSMLMQNLICRIALFEFSKNIQ